MMSRFVVYLVVNEGYLINSFWLGRCFLMCAVMVAMIRRNCASQSLVLGRRNV